MTKGKSKVHGEKKAKERGTFTFRSRASDGHRYAVTLYSKYFSATELLSLSGVFRRTGGVANIFDETTGRSVNKESFSKKLLSRELEFGVY